MIRSKRLARSCPRRPNPRARGEWAEAAFLKRALTLGFAVCRPFCEHYPFDFVLVSPSGNTCRVQVKSGWMKRTGNGYQLRLSKRNAARYRNDDVDFIAGYIGPEDAWYIIPVNDVTSGTAWFFPGIRGSRSHWERYREAWHLLQPSPGHPPGK